MKFVARTGCSCSSAPLPLRSYAPLLSGSVALPFLTRLQLQGGAQAFLADDFQAQAGLAELEEALAVFAQFAPVDLEAQAGPGEGLDTAVRVGQDGVDDALAEFRHPGRFFQGVLQRQLVVGVGQDQVPVDIKSDAVGPGVGREEAAVCCTSIDDLFDLGDAAGEGELSALSAAASERAGA